MLSELTKYIIWFDKRNTVRSTI